MRRLVMLLAGALASLAALATPAQAVESDRVAVTDATQLSAYGRWVAWSEQQPDGRWRLVALRPDGTKALLPVHPRPQPFDVDLGPDDRGRPVATYSRCVQEPGTAARDVTGLVSFAAAKGCSLRELRLGEHRDHVLRVPRRLGDVDATPSRFGWHVAFSRLRAGARVAQLVRVDLRTGREEPLPHGAMPRDHAPSDTGTVQALDLGPRALAFLWQVRSSQAYGVGVVWELRGVRLSDRRRVLAAAGFISGACGARLPVSPQVLAGRLTFLDTRYDCQTTTSVLGAQAFSAPIARVSGDVPGQVDWQAASDPITGFVYAIRAARTEVSSANDACRASAPCRLVRLDPPPPTTTPRSKRPAGSPFV